MILTGTLMIDGQRCLLSADYTLRFVDGDKVQVSLYYKGQRVVKAWALGLLAHQEDRSSEGNANTC